MDHWTTAESASWNRRLSALVSFTTWAQRQDLPATHLGRRKTTRRGDRAIPRARLETLRHPPRERALWRLLDETAARAEEILSLDVADLDLEYRRARVVSKGGANEYVHWATGTARLLPRLPWGGTGPSPCPGRLSLPCRSAIRSVRQMIPTVHLEQTCRARNGCARKAAMVILGSQAN